MPFQHDIDSSMVLMSDLVLEARQQADIVGSDHVTDAEIQNWIQCGLSDAYDMVTNTFDDYYVNSELFVLQGVGAPEYQNYLLSPNDVSTADWTKFECTTPTADQVVENITGYAPLHYVRQIVHNLQIDESIRISAEFNMAGVKWIHMVLGNDTYVDAYVMSRGSEVDPQVAVIGQYAGGIAKLEPVIGPSGMDSGWYRVTLDVDGENELTDVDFRIYTMSGTTATDEGVLHYAGTGLTLSLRNISVLQPIYSWYFKLPTDFYKILRLDRSFSGQSTNNDWYALERLNVRDEATWNMAWSRSITAPRPAGYIITDNILKIIPTQLCAGTYRLLYYPCYPTLALTDRVDLGPPGAQWHEMGVLTACARIAIKEEGDPNPYWNQLKEVVEKIKSGARDRDAGRAEPPPQTGVPWYNRTNQGGMGWNGMGGGWL